MIMMEPFETYFQKNYSTLNIDFPGFGLSAPLNEAWTIYDYANALEALLDHLQIKNPIFVAHSFGARVALILAHRSTTSTNDTYRSSWIKTKIIFRNTY
jgi:pimeloyl-ACP methyl ester carboxylesterase